MTFSDWKSQVGSYEEKSRDHLLALTTPPWSGGLQLMIGTDQKTLILDDDQMKYTFTKK